MALDVIWLLMASISIGCRYQFEELLLFWSVLPSLIFGGNCVSTSFCFCGHVLYRRQSYRWIEGLGLNRESQEGPIWQKYLPGAFESTRTSPPSWIEARGLIWRETEQNGWIAQQILMGLVKMWTSRTDQCPQFDSHRPRTAPGDKLVLTRSALSRFD